MTGEEQLAVASDVEAEINVDVAAAGADGRTGTGGLHVGMYKNQQENKILSLMTTSICVTYMFSSDFQ